MHLEAAAPETVATAAWNTLADLAVDASSLSWTENGEPRGAAL